MLLTEFRILHNSNSTSSCNLFLSKFLKSTTAIPPQPQRRSIFYYCSSSLLTQRKANLGIVDGKASPDFSVPSRSFSKDVGKLQFFRINVMMSSSNCRNFSTTSSSHLTDRRSGSGSSSNKAVSKSAGGSGQVAISLGEKVKENAKTATYGGVILLGIAVTAAMGYLILSELLSSESPNNIYTKSFKLCKANQEVLDILGSPIKCYGEETRRGWRRHVAHQQFLHGDTKILRMRFYVEGKFNKGTVHVEKKSNVNGKYEYSYIVVDVDGYPTRRIVIDL